MMVLFDSHIHTLNSHDGKSKADDICNSAMKFGLSGIAITDHCDINAYVKENLKGRITSSVRDVDIAKEKYKTKLKISKGIELGQPLFNKEYAFEILNFFDFDFVLGSVHELRDAVLSINHRHIDYSALSNEKINEYLNKYFIEVYETIEFGHFDVLAHLTLLLRYTNGKAKRNITLDQHKEIITEILTLLVEKDIGLELNVSGLNTDWKESMPNKEILQMFKNLGGSIVTIGSDAHISDNVGIGIREGIELLKEIGYNYYAFYENRTPKMVKI